MSTRRNFILAATAGVAASGATYAVTAGAPQPDPILALLDAEATAWKVYDMALKRYSKAEQAWWASEWHRKPRVQVGVSVAFCRGQDFEPIPADELVEEPVYVHSREAIDRDCAHYGRFKTDLTPEQVEERRERMHAEFEADEAAIANAPEAILYEQAEAEQGRLSTAHFDAAHALLAVRPMTIAGLLALIDRIRDRSDSFCDEIDETLAHVSASARALLDGRTA